MSKKKQKFNNKQNTNSKQMSQVKKNVPKPANIEEQKTHWLTLLPVLFIITILPLIVRLHEYETPLSEYPWFSYNNIYVDFFLYYKQWLFISASLIMAIIIVVRAYLDKSVIKFSPIFIPLTVYALLALLSSVFSKYRNYSFTGMFEQFESVFVLLGYCLVVYYIYLFVQSENDIKLIIKCLLIGVLLLSLIGLTQFIGHDFFATETGLRLITPSIYWNSLDTISFNFGKNRVYLSLYNPNYVGVYVSLVLPILIVLTIFNRKLWMFPVYLLAIAGLIICLIGSHSTAGIIAIVVALALMLILFWRYLLKYFYIAIPLILLCTTSTMLYNKKSDYYLTNQLKEITKIEKTQPSLTDIKTLDDELIITYKDNDLKVRFYVDDNGICILDLFDSEYDIVQSTFEELNGPVTIQDERFPGFVLTPIIYNDVYAFTVKIDGHEWQFTNQTDDNSYYYINKMGRLDKINTAPSAIFTGYEKYASGRGYIWSRTIPLLKKNFILGSGADTFVLEFPQQDYVNLYNYGYSTQLMTKPHSLYLQIGVQTGVLSLIAFIVFYLMYFITSFRIYIKGRFDHYYTKVGLAIFIGTFSYMFVGISNDSTITVAPVFWVLIGLGIVINNKARAVINSSSDKPTEL